MHPSGGLGNRREAPGELVGKVVARYIRDLGGSWTPQKAVATMSHIGATVGIRPDLGGKH